MKVLMCSEKDLYVNCPGGPDFQFFTEENLKMLYELFDEVVWNETGRQFTKEELIEKVQDCDAVITCWRSNMFDKEILDHAPKLKIIAHLCGSVSYVVNEDAYNKGILVIGANNMQFAESVAEAALLYSIAKLRNLDNVLKLIHNEKEDGWRKRPTGGRGLLGKTVGIVSFGAIAEYYAGMLQPFHCNIKVYSRNISDEKLEKYNMKRTSLEEIFATCDVISIHTAKNKHTLNMINKDLIKSMKDGAVLINTARGAVIDEVALIEELKTGRINAALDVFWKEPLPVDNPLYDLDNVMIMPHCGGPTHDMYQLIARDIMKYVYDYLTRGIMPPEVAVISKERALNMTQ